jgi:hypothetical protein
MVDDKRMAIWVCSCPFSRHDISSSSVASDATIYAVLKLVPTKSPARNTTGDRECKAALLTQKRDVDCAY